MKKIPAISGSLRAESTSLSIIEQTAEMFADLINPAIYESFARLPHFNTAEFTGRNFCAGS